MSETTVTLMTTGMHCRSCSMMIDMTLGELDGVQEATSDHAAGSTTVVFDDDIVSVDEIVGAIRGAGYEAEAPSA